VVYHLDYNVYDVLKKKRNATDSHISKVHVRHCRDSMTITHTIYANTVETGSINGSAPFIS
jgi:hypothetical protein